MINNEIKSIIADKIRQFPAKSNSDIADLRAMRRSRVKADDVAIVRAGMPAAAKTLPIGKSVASLLGQFDELAKVLGVMKGLSKGAYLDDDEMRTTANVPMRSWNAVKAHPRVQEFRYKLPNQRFVWMHPAAQAELSRAINLAQT